MQLLCSHKFYQARDDPLPSYRITMGRFSKSQHANRAIAAKQEAKRARLSNSIFFSVKLRKYRPRSIPSYTTPRRPSILAGVPDPRSRGWTRREYFKL
ncbi:unnamed protein product [Tuber melanosporum]|uniref:(Perigord truffle) hypothetical protein n=1 Tax=Tuber melanosporum (strain Mel28) TaxID=656061 RepID=D5GIV8_TUBMM|nr:uncharacterized protein GSTUM_00008706001 [Tuber melanosporum]CAZ84451.1 unnamed protein product [Tuber melanosporum]